LPGDVLDVPEAVGRKYVERGGAVVLSETAENQPTIETAAYGVARGRRRKSDVLSQ